MMYTKLVYLYALFFVSMTTSAEDHLYLLSETGSGRATAYAETNKIVTIGNKTHAAWLDSVGEKFFIRIRTLDHETNTWSPVYTVGETYDNHGGPALTADSEGYLHIVYYPHHHPFRYRRSLQPNDASAWTPETQFGSKCTYPSMVCDKNGTLYLVCRESVDEKWKLNLYSKAKDGDWSGPIAIFEGNAGKGYVRFQASLALGKNGKSLHLAFMTYEREMGEKGYMIGYMESHDGGTTWQCRNGRTLLLPANPGTVEFVEMANPEISRVNMRMGSLAIDNMGKPWVMYSRLDQQPFETFLATVSENDEWIKMPLLPLIQKHFPNRGVQTPGSIAFTEDGSLYAVVTTVKAHSAYENSFWGDPSDEVVLLVSKDGGKLFDTYPVSTPDDSIPNWLPSLQRPTSPSSIQSPYLMFTQGFRGDNNQQIMANKVYWCDVERLLTIQK